MQLPAAFERHVFSGLEPALGFDVVYGGHFEHRLLSTRRATMEHQRLVLGDVRVETGCYDFPVIALGAMPRDAVCIGLVAEGAERTRCNTEAIEDNEVHIYGPGVELMYHAAGHSHWINFTVPEAKLQAHASERAGRSLKLPRRGIVRARLDRGGRARLQLLVHDAVALAGELQPDGIGQALAEAISHALVSAYVDALCAAEMTDQAPRTASAWRHHHVILACERLVRGGEMMKMDLTEIARRSGYTLRTLELIFRGSVGMTPGRYFLNMRLNGALRDLLRGGPGGSVTEVASRWGFRHLSRFAAQYHQAFGELPSQTLTRR